jgi:hypothetical protein
MARRRWGKTYRNEEIGVIRQGYYITFFTYLAKDWKKFASVLYNSFFHKKDVGLQPFEEANIRRATIEIGLYMLLGVLVSLLAVGDDEEDEDVSSARWFALYQIRRLRKELGSLMPTPTIIGDNWRLLKSPSAFNGTIDRVVSLSGQFYDPFAVYEKQTGVFEKGDSKLYAKFLKLFGNISNMTTIEEHYKNLQRTF